ncbi:hypothetical protein [Solitalea lacus]|nr:hypothetical protein [Solitalea lacus]UKJ06505.1 hypothetical protein L2B55_13290 [Solitalea lacus]
MERKDFLKSSINGIIGISCMAPILITVTLNAQTGGYDLNHTIYISA